MNKIIIFLIILVVIYICCSTRKEPFDYGFGSVYNTQYVALPSCENIPGIGRELKYDKRCGWLPEPMAAPNDTLKIINKFGGYINMVGNKNDKAIVREYNPPLKISNLLIPSGYRVILECEVNNKLEYKQYDNNNFYNELIGTDSEFDVVKVILLWLR